MSLLEAFIGGVDGGLNCSLNWLHDLGVIVLIKEQQVVQGLSGLFYKFFV